MFVPVIDINSSVLMPTTPAKARKLIRSKMAIPFWNKGVFCIRLTYVVNRFYKQNVAVGIDPGSKREGFSVKSKSHTYLNIQANAVTWVKKAIKTRKEMRRSRRYRKTPCRANHSNRERKLGWIAPSTKARWQWKLRITTWLSKMFPITCFVVEDIKAKAWKGKRRWNVSFSPLEVGKKWFYQSLEKIALVKTIQGYETKEMRDKLGLKKSSKKLSAVFEAHCVDSWVLANSIVGGDIVDNKAMLLIVPLRFHRRQLHRMLPSKGGIRSLYGGTRSLGFKRGSLVKHPKWGLTYVGWHSKGKLSLHSLTTGKRLCQNVCLEDLKFLTFNSWRIGGAVSFTSIARCFHR